MAVWDRSVSSAICRRERPAKYCSAENASRRWRCSALWRTAAVPLNSGNASRTGRLGYDISDLGDDVAPLNPLPPSQSRPYGP